MTIPESEPQPAVPDEETNPATELEGEPPAEGGNGEGEADADAEGEPAEASPPEGEPPPETGELEGRTQAEWEEMFTKAEKAFSTYTRRISDLWGDEATALIPLTISPSAPPGFIDARDAGRIPDEVKKPLLEFLGIHQEREYKFDSRFPTCPNCDGEGQIATGSHNPNFLTLQCTNCNGRGYVDQMAGMVNGATTPEAGTVPVAAAVPQEPTGDVDDWGIARIMEDGRPNPNFGKTPRFWDRAYPVGSVSG